MDTISISQILISHIMRNETDEAERLIDREINEITFKDIKPDIRKKVLIFLFETDNKERFLKIAPYFSENEFLSSSAEEMSILGKMLTRISKEDVLNTFYLEVLDKIISSCRYNSYDCCLQMRYIDYIFFHRMERIITPYVSESTLKLLKRPFENRLRREFEKLAECDIPSSELLEKSFSAIPDRCSKTVKTYNKAIMVFGRCITTRDDFLTLVQTDYTVERIVAGNIKGNGYIVIENVSDVNFVRIDSNSIILLINEKSVFTISAVSIDEKLNFKNSTFTEKFFEKIKEHSYKDAIVLAIDNISFSDNEISEDDCYDHFINSGVADVLSNTEEMNVIEDDFPF